MRIESDHPELTIARQCELLGLGRSSLYYAPAPPGAEDSRLMKLLDRQYIATPFYGVRKMAEWLLTRGESVNVKRVRRLMGLEAIYAKPRTSVRCPENKVYPYLLRGLTIDRADQAWCADITYIPMRVGWAYLVAVMDWFSRCVLAWELSVTLDTTFCVEALGRALGRGRVPGVFNTDQGSQFTSAAFTGALQDAGVAISMDGRGRAFDNIFIERLWRSVKYEDVYLRDYQTPAEAWLGLGRYFEFYNHQRLHQALDYRTPASVYDPLAPSPGMFPGAAMGGKLDPLAVAPVALRAPSATASSTRDVHLISP